MFDDLFMKIRLKTYFYENITNNLTNLNNLRSLKNVDLKI